MRGTEARDRGGVLSLSLSLSFYCPQTVIAIEHFRNNSLSTCEAHAGGAGASML